MTHAATPVFVIHAGAGIVAKNVTPEKEKLVRADLEKALKAGYAVLKSGGDSLDAVTQAIVIMEDAPEFNAGKGAVFNHDGKNELDASIMDGATLRAGAVANVHRVKNPILLARAVMEKSPHVMMVGDGAEAFAQSIGMSLVDPKYFYTDQRWQELQDALKDRGGENQIDGVAAWHRRRRCARHQRQSRRGHVDRRHDQQTIRTRRRFADHRRGHLREREVCRVGHGLGRVLHPRRCRARYLRTG